MVSRSLSRSLSPGLRSRVGEDGAAAPLQCAQQNQPRVPDHGVDIDKQRGDVHRQLPPRLKRSRLRMLPEGATTHRQRRHLLQEAAAERVVALEHAVGAAGLRWSLLAAPTKRFGRRRKV